MAAVVEFGRAESIRKFSFGLTGQNKGRYCEKELFLQLILFLSIEGFDLGWFDQIMTLKIQLS